MATSYVNLIAKSPAGAIVPRAIGVDGFRTLFGARPVETLDPGKVLFFETDPANHVFEVLKGALRLYKLMPDGRRAITGFIFPGEILGVAFKDRYLYSAEAVTQVRLQRYPRAQLHDNLARSPGLSREVLAMACDELSAAQDQVLLLARKSAYERIASFLLTVARRLSADGEPVREIDLPMTRLDIADYLGLTIETVSRAFSKLKADGLIALPSPHKVVVRRAGVLMVAAGEIERDEDDEPAMPRTVRGAVWPN